MKLIENYSHNNEGYNPYLIRPNWQVAQLNYSKEQELENIEKLDVHLKTDEVFILTKGKAILIGASIKSYKISYTMELMKPGIVYNIPKEVWHNIVMYEGAEVIIVENANTHLPLPEGDYEFYYFTDEQKKEFREKVKSIIKK